MKKQSIILFLLIICCYTGFAQNNNLHALIAKLDQAQTVKDYEQLEKTFSATSSSPSWLAPYYAALCNAKIGFLLQDDGEKIEPYSNQGEEQIKKAISLLDTARQHKELAEAYTVLSMVYRTKVFINPMTYGRKYGTASDQYLKQARALDPQNPRALYVAAWVKYATPKMWGGDKDQARQLATESLKNIGTAGTDDLPHWGKNDDQALLNKIK
ncbi:hypothetical protein [Chitinophaga sp. 212800010-3]|uniref:hypothetical protein n=1 Tax=unclassified Chitinophaga TaxID=2619133 RepID=UPI002DEF3976|nr:TPR-REGION domain-containing protein [Chitinophaga sp. 212800010-3]